jgi:hypothetical protein
VRVIGEEGPARASVRSGRFLDTGH